MRIKARLGSYSLPEPGIDSRNPIVTVIEFYQHRYEGFDGREHSVEMARYYDQNGQFGTTDPKWLRVLEDWEAIP